MDQKNQLFVPSKATSLRKLTWFSKKVGNIPEKSSDLNENRTIRLIISENPNLEVSSSYLQKCDFLYWFVVCLKTDRAYVFICFIFVFPRDDLIEPMCLQVQ